MDKRELKIITQDYAENYIKLFNRKVERLIQSSAIKGDTEWEKAYELRRVVVKVALESLICRLSDIDPRLEEDYQNLQRV